MEQFIKKYSIGIACIFLFVWILVIPKHNFNTAMVESLKTYNDYYITTNVKDSIPYKYEGPLPVKIIGMQERVTYLYENEKPQFVSSNLIMVSGKDTLYSDYLYKRTLPEFPFWILDTNSIKKIDFVTTIHNNKIERIYPDNFAILANTDNDLLYRDFNPSKPIIIFERGFIMKSKYFIQKK